MSLKVVITQKQNKYVQCIFDGDKLIELAFTPMDEQIIGNIYVGRVSKVMNNLSAAFVKIREDLECYLPFDEMIPINREWKEGDLIMVQVTKEAIKTKAPSLTMKVSLSGKMIVITRGKPGIGYSSKLSANQKKRLKTFTADWNINDYGIIVRTNAADCGEEEIQTEFHQLYEQFNKIMEFEKSRVLYSCLHQSPPSYIERIRDIGIDQISQAVTDVPQVMQQMKNYLSKENRGTDYSDKLRFYEDKMLSLYNLYSLEAKISEALDKKVWLKSGGYLVIEQTETLSVIDVNTGKYTGKNTSQETFYKINMEAAKEAARQIRLRNLSGMILIDFINLNDSDKEDSLIRSLTAYLREDPIRTNFVDITGCKLVEITRRKTTRSLKEQYYGLS